MCFGLSVLVAVSSVMWVARGTAQKNTVTLLRKTADVAVARLIDQITIHLGAARSQSEFLAEMIGRGEIGAKDRENLADALLGALAAAPQVTGIGYFSVEGWSLRVGRGQRGPVRLFNPQEPEPAIRLLLATLAPDAGSEGGGVFWVENLSQAHLTIESVEREVGT